MFFFASSIHVFHVPQNKNPKAAELHLFNTDTKNGALVMFAASDRDERIKGNTKVHAYNEVAAHMDNLFVDHPLYRASALHWPDGFRPDYNTMPPENILIGITGYFLAPSTRSSHSAPDC